MPDYWEGLFKAVAVPDITPFFRGLTDVVVTLMLRSRSESWLNKRKLAVRDMKTLISQLPIPPSAMAFVSRTFFEENGVPFFSMTDRINAHLAARMAVDHGYSPAYIREKLRGKNLFPLPPSNRYASSLQLTNLVLAGYEKDYASPSKIRMGLFSELEDVFYAPFKNLDPKFLLPRVVQTYSRIMRIGMLRGGEGLFKANSVEYLERFLSIACLHTNGVFIRDKNFDDVLDIISTIE